MSARPAVVALVPTRDEATTLPRFLEAALTWADAVVVCDQHSRDGTVEIARAFDRVTVVVNEDREFDEGSRKRQLIAAARRLVPGPRFLVALDADELLSANVLTSAAWEQAVHAAPGTRVQLGPVELCRRPSEYYVDWGADRGTRVTFAYADDGREQRSGRIHGARLPEPEDAPQVVLEDVVVLHFAMSDPARVASKDRWYQCFERLHESARDAVEIRRRYDWRERLGDTFDVRPVRDEWLAGYSERGIDVATRPGPGVYWTDWDVLRMFAEHGLEPFAHLDVWSVDWEALRRRGLREGIARLPDFPVVPPGGATGRLARGLLSRSGRWRGGRYVDAVMRRTLAR